MRLVILEAVLKKYWDNDTYKDLIDEYSVLALLIAGLNDEKRIIEVENFIHESKKDTKFKITLEYIDDNEY